MRHVAAIVAVAAASLFAAAPALADVPGATPPAVQLSLNPAQQKLVQQLISLQQTRVTELTAVSSNAHGQVTTLTAQATANDAEAKSFKDQAKGFRDAASSTPDGDGKKRLNQMADDCDKYAGRDKAFADQERAAAAILQAQGDTADKAIVEHNASIAKLQALLKS
jgi:hypothetical protein